MKSMKRDLNQIAGKEFDLAIIGGGITGAGVALDATLRGLKVVLLEKNDFASGTSGISSKLVHGGLRYLEHGEFPLVFEALQERGLLLKNASHLVGNLRFLLPVFQNSRVPLWKWRIGLKLYDLLAIGCNPEASKTLAPHQWKSLSPAWNEKPLACLQYMDAQMEDARLCLDVIHSAALQGATVANHLEVTALDLFQGRVGRIETRDLLTGERLECGAKVVLNATGPWCDNIRAMAQEGTAEQVKPTKGIHIVLPDWQLPHAMLLLHPEDGRVFFVIPWMGRTVVGTTDTAFEGKPDEVVATHHEVDYLMRGVRHYLQLETGKDQVLQSFAGLRPLISSSSSPSDRSREFAIQEGKNGMFSVSGGKYTTYRSMAQKITNAICSRLGNQAKCQTKHHLLSGAYSVPRRYFYDSGQMELKYQYGITGDAALQLLNRYGTKAGLVARYVKDHSSQHEKVLFDLPDLIGEFAYHKDHEMAMLERDFLYQRTRIGLLSSSSDVAEAARKLTAVTTRAGV